MKYTVPDGLFLFPHTLTLSFYLPCVKQKEVKCAPRVSRSQNLYGSLKAGVRCEVFTFSLQEREKHLTPDLASWFQAILGKDAKA